jgi:hypothetical protein
MTMENTNEEFKIMTKGSFTDEQYDFKAEEIKTEINKVIESYENKGYWVILNLTESRSKTDKVILANKTNRFIEGVNSLGKPIYSTPFTYSEMP